jgi:hypothetical protein
MRVTETFFSSLGLTTAYLAMADPLRPSATNYSPSSPLANYVPQYYQESENPSWSNTLGQLRSSYGTANPPWAPAPPSHSHVMTTGWGATDTYQEPNPPLPDQAAYYSQYSSSVPLVPPYLAAPSTSSSTASSYLPQEAAYPRQEGGHDQGRSRHYQE